MLHLYPITSALLFLALLSLRPRPARARRGARPSIQLDSQQARAGASLGFAGSGFTPRRRVRFWTVAPDQAMVEGVGQLVADAGGKICGRLALPGNAPSGTWSIVFEDARGRQTISYFYVAPTYVQAQPILAYAGAWQSPDLRG